MDALFKYYAGSLEDFIAQARNKGDNHLIKIRLAPAAMPEYPGYWLLFEKEGVQVDLSELENASEDRNLLQ